MVGVRRSPGLATCVVLNPAGMQTKAPRQNGKTGGMSPLKNRELLLVLTPGPPVLTAKRHSRASVRAVLAQSSSSSTGEGCAGQPASVLQRRSSFLHRYFEARDLRQSVSVA